MNYVEEIATYVPRCEAEAAEKEIILVVAPGSHKKAIMQAIGEACGFQSAAHGVVLSLPVEEAIGLKLPTED